MSANYCCDRMEEASGQHGSHLIDHSKHGTFNISGCGQCYVVTDAKYCPWCGANQAKPAQPIPEKSTD